MSTGSARYPFTICRLGASAAWLAVFILAAAAQTPPSLTTLYAFRAKDEGPSAGMVAAGRGFYGTTAATVFALWPASGDAWAELSLDYVNQPIGIALGPKGVLYGMTLEGGGSAACPDGCGTVFELAPPTSRGAPWTKTLLHIFGGGSDGAFPTGAPQVGPDGTIYGTTQYGGGGGCSGILPGCGTVFALTPPASPGDPWTETLLYTFQAAGDGANPGGGLVIDLSGALYGTTPFGGDYFRGTVFRLNPPSTTLGDAWTKTVIYSFAGQREDGVQPSSGLVADGDGVIYGTTAFGGRANGGTVFALYPPASGNAWTEKVLYSFEVQGGLLPIPNGNLAIGKGGALYGTTAHGGISARSCSYGCGLIYGLYPASPGGEWRAEVLHSFAGGSEGGGPHGGLVIGDEGALYGTTLYGGDVSCKAPIGCGTAFRVVP